jgi:hypothetical protein
MRRVVKHVLIKHDPGISWQPCGPAGKIEWMGGCCAIAAVNFMAPLYLLLLLLVLLLVQV